MDFEAFPKIPRLNRDIVVTEKIDGTNAAVLIEEWDSVAAGPNDRLAKYDDGTVSQWYRVQAQSRKRLINPADDNAGFARWVHANAEDLVRLMGPGRHFGEWWGQGIQRGYGLDHKVFSLFNPTFDLHADGDSFTLGDHEITTVPVLYEGPFSQWQIIQVVEDLRTRGSVAAPGFDRPEGVIVFHTASRGLFKVTCQNDEKPKGSME